MRPKISEEDLANCCEFMEGVMRAMNLPLAYVIGTVMPEQRSRVLSSGWFNRHLAATTKWFPEATNIQTVYLKFGSMAEMPVVEPGVIYTTPVESSPEKSRCTFGGGLLFDGIGITTSKLGEFQDLMATVWAYEQLVRNSIRAGAITLINQPEHTPKLEDVRHESVAANVRGAILHLESNRLNETVEFMNKAFSGALIKVGKTYSHSVYARNVTGYGNLQLGFTLQAAKTAG